VWGKADVQDLIARSDLATARAVALVYANQTQAEQAAQTTRDSNGVGFTAVDAEFLTSAAQFYERRGFLTPKQLAVARNKVKKYWRQILDDMRRRGYEVAFK
jgi:hypothetical protein